MMVLGQAPGITEKEAGRPFNAGSGTRLFQWLEAAGIEEDWFRSTQYMTSITKCYPGRAKSGSGDRVPSKDEQLLCRPFLEGEIELLDPELIMPVGRLAIEYFFPSKPPLKDVIGTQAAFRRALDRAPAASFRSKPLAPDRGEPGVDPEGVGVDSGALRKDFLKHL